MLLGVNSDADREQVRQVVARLGINWRSWWADGPDGAIPRQWRITGWPTMIVIDAQGIVRHRLGSAQDLDRILETLVREAEQGAVQTSRR